MQSPIEFVRSRKWPHLIQGNKIVLYKCPLCNSERTFEMHFISGRWLCSSCGAAGGLYDLKVSLGLVQPIHIKAATDKLNPLDDFHIKKIKEAHERLLSDKSKLDELLSKRPITLEAVKKFELGLAYIENDDGEVEPYLVYPHKFKGIYYNAKLRSWFGYPKKFQRIPNQPTILYNADCLLKQPKTILLSEGEADCIVAFSCGITNVVGITGGAKSNLPLYFLELLEPVERIIIALDGDPAGRDGAKKLAKQLGIHRCFLVDFGDGLDLSDYVSLYGKEAFLNLVKRARPFSVGDIETFDSVLEQIASTPTEDRLLSTGYSNLDRIIGGYDPDGFLITLAGPPKSCKTTLSSALAWNFAMMHGPALIFCLEMDKKKVNAVVRSQFTCGSRKNNPVDAGALLLNSPRAPLLQAYMGNITPEVVLETIRESFYRYGVRFVVFDNINYLVRDTENKASKLADLSKEFAVLAKELGMIILLIAQPKKLQRTRGKDYEMTSSDIAWTSALEADSDLILIINRPRIYAGNQTFSPVFKVVAEASRYAPGGVSYFVLDDYSASVFQVPLNYYDSIDKTFSKLFKSEDEK